jgi:hypothetical protein
LDIGKVSIKDTKRVEFGNVVTPDLVCTDE